ncbi:hypothetical protein ACJJTC_016619 [Scirpophaga incertulas]
MITECTPTYHQRSELGESRYTKTLRDAVYLNTYVRARATSVDKDRSGTAGNRRPFGSPEWKVDREGTFWGRRGGAQLQRSKHTQKQTQKGCHVEVGVKSTHLGRGCARSLAEACGASAAAANGVAPEEDIEALLTCVLGAPPPAPPAPPPAGPAPPAAGPPEPAGAPFPLATPFVDPLFCSVAELCFGMLLVPCVAPPRQMLADS